MNGPGCRRFCLHLAQPKAVNQKIFQLKTGKTSNKRGKARKGGKEEKVEKHLYKYHNKIKYCQL